jgi:hypothetical protein
MLKMLRQKHTAKMVLWGLVILILPAFVLWGTGSLSGSKGGLPKFVGTIGGHKVKFDELYESILSIRSQIFLNYFNQPQVLEAFLKNRPFLAKLGWDRLVMLTEARREKVKVSNAELVAFIRSHPLFSRNGVFDEKMYGYILRNNMGLEPRVFEEITRQNLTIRKLNDNLTKDVKISDEEVLDEYRKEFGKFKIAYTLVEPAAFLKDVTIDDAMAKEYYEKNKGLIAVSPGQAGDFESLKAGIKSLLAEREASGLAYKYADELYRKITAMTGEKLSFEDALVKLNLKPLLSNFFSRGEYIEGVGEAMPVVAEAARLKPGEVSVPTEVRKGIIIFKVTATEDISLKKFEAEKEEFAKKVLLAKKNIVLEKWLRDLEKNTKLNIDFKDLENYYR